MSWLKRMFGMEKPAAAKVAPTPAPGATPPAGSPDAGADTIPPYRLGLEGEYDDSGLAKRVALAFDNDADLNDIETLWVAQLSSKVVLKGQVPTQADLDKCVQVASGVMGATEVDASQVTVG